MWEPVNATRIPTEQELIHARYAIKNAEEQLGGAFTELEGLRMGVKGQDRDLEGLGASKAAIQQADIMNELTTLVTDDEYHPSTANEYEDTVKATALIRTAQLRADDLNSYLRRIRAWISPIRRLNPDALSRIFELCAEAEWTSPLQIATVSRGWRNVVLATPRAWEFVDLEYYLPHDTVRAFFDRSGQRPLHIYLPAETPLSFLSNVAARVNCLSVDGYDWSHHRSIPDTDEICFPNVKRLYIRGYDRHTWLSYINAAHFPSLHCLVSMGGLVDGDGNLLDGTLALPPLLDTISLIVGRDRTWITLIENRQDVLVSLEINLLSVAKPHAPLVVRAILPRLKCLVITFPEYMHGKWDSATPALETYVERRDRAPSGAQTGHLLHRDLGAIRALRLRHEPTLSFLPKLTILQMEGISNLISILNQLRSHSALCPQLERIELLIVARLDPKEDPLEDARDFVEEANRVRYCPIQLNAVDYDKCTSLPGMISGSNTWCAMQSLVMK